MMGLEVTVTRTKRFAARRTLLLAILVVLIVVIAASIFAREDLYAMFQALSRANPMLVILAFGVYLFGVAFWAGRWNVTLSRVGHRVGLRNLYVVILGGIFVNNVTPFTYSGGDPVARAYLLNKTQRISYSSGFATILGEFILDFPVFLSFVMIGLLLSTKWTPIWPALMIVMFWVAIIIGWSLLFWHVLRGKMAAARIGGLLARIMGFFRRPANKKRITRGIKKFYAEAERIISSRKVAFYVITFSAILWLFGIARLFVIFKALEYWYTPPLEMLVLATTLPWMAGLIPLLPAGIGTVDVAMILIFMKFMPPELYPIAAAAWAIERAISFLFGTVVGACALSYLGVRVWAK